MVPQSEEQDARIKDVDVTDGRITDGHLFWIQLHGRVQTSLNALSTIGVSPREWFAAEMCANRLMTPHHTKPKSGAM